MRDNIRYNNLHGVAQALAVNLFQPFLGIFAIKLGGSNTIVALLSALPALTSAVAMIPGAIWLERLPRRKGPAAVLFLVSRLFLLAIALVPLFSRDARAPLLAALAGLMNLPAAMATVSWTALCGDVFPGRPGAGHCAVASGVRPPGRPVGAGPSPTTGERKAPVRPPGWFSFRAVPGV